MKELLRTKSEQTHREEVKCLQNEEKRPWYEKHMQEQGK